MTSRYIRAIRALDQGGVIAYPTEAVYGLGCDPFNQAAVGRLLRIKQRSVRKGLIVVASTIEQFSPWIADLPSTLLDRCYASWPGPVTWVVPLDLMSQPFPYWITGEYDSVALRVSDHPVVKALCSGFHGPIVSTSANLAGRVALSSAVRVRLNLGQCIDEIVVGEVGISAKPTIIKELLTDKILRQ